VLGHAGVTREALILAGGFGTRLRSAVADRPKPMAEVAGRPFITFLLSRLVDFGFERAILCTGHMGEVVVQLLGDTFGPMSVVYSHEPTPLGTAGALRQAVGLIESDDVLVLNGDSFCDVDLATLGCKHRAHGGAATIVVLHRNDRRQSGAVGIEESGRVVVFESRPAASRPGLINAGIYMLRREIVERIPVGRKVSLEDEIFPLLVANGTLFAWQVDARFIDIGTPDSYAAAQTFF
jgi:NDP-sugar pyrophosphorylase family protein